MLPFMLASIFGIIVFGINILFVNSNVTYAVEHSLLINSQSKSASLDKVHANTGLPPVAEPKKNSRRVSDDLKSPKSPSAVKTEAQKVNNNTRVNVPAAGIQPKNAEVKKTGSSTNVISHAKTQSWLIQAGAFSIESSAVRVKNRIASLGYGVEIIKTGTEKPLFKVVVSAGNSGAAPNDALKKLSSIGIEGYIITGRP